MHPLVVIDATSPQIAEARIALVRDVMIGVMTAFLLAGLPIWILYGVLRVSQLLG